MECGKEVLEYREYFDGTGSGSKRCMRRVRAV